MTGVYEWREGLLESGSEPAHAARPRCAIRGGPMPRTFFDQVLVTEAPRRGSGWMKAASLVLHLAIVLAILILPITAAFDLPGVYTSLPPVIQATTPALPAVVA